MAAVAVLWSSMLAAAAAAGFDLLGAEPLSYLGTRPPSAVLFTGGLVAAAVLLVVFHEHLRDRYPVAPGFSAAMLAGLAGQLVAAVVPIGGDPGVHRVHTGSALLLGASLPVLMWRFAAAQRPGSWRRLAYALFWVEAAACGVGLYLSAAGAAAVAEILPAAVFHCWIAALTFSPVGVLSPADTDPVRVGRLDPADDVGDAGHALQLARRPTGLHP
ncbi:MAG: hypothetical protein M3203_03285 [Actinomycetota bacterium]|nr:hypothetical protein [Actinomycetota bacterium]